jgi:hypothetical protein
MPIAGSRPRGNFTTTEELSRSNPTNPGKGKWWSKTDGGAVFETPSLPQQTGETQTEYLRRLREDTVELVQTRGWV